MAYFHSHRIVTDGLVLYLDAANNRSYPGNGDNWYNLSINGGFLSKGTYLPEYTILGGNKCFNFNQIGSYFYNTSIFSYPIPSDKTNLTIDVWFYPSLTELSIGDNGNIIKGSDPSFYMSWNKSVQKQSNYWYGKLNEGYHESGYSIIRGSWNNIVAVWNSNYLYQYLNNNKTIAQTSGVLANQTLGVEVGWEQDPRQFSGGISVIRLYNIALTDDQVKQNYNAMKGRFGL